LEISCGGVKQKRRDEFARTRVKDGVSRGWDGGGIDAVTVL
jgi:hypothetical protein